MYLFWYTRKLKKEVGVFSQRMHQKVLVLFVVVYECYECKGYLELVQFVIIMNILFPTAYSWIVTNCSLG